MSGLRDKGVVRSARCLGYETKALSVVHDVWVTRPRRCPWCTMECSKLAAWTTSRCLLLASRVKTNQFRLHPTQSCALGRRYDRVSSVYHVAHGKCSSISRVLRDTLTTTIHATGPLGFVPHAYHPPPNPCPHIQPTIAMTMLHAATVTNSSAFRAQL